MLDITCQPPAKPARPLVLQEPLAARQDRARVLTLQQDILYHLLVRRVRLHAGYYQASSGQTSCDAADAGYYVSGTAQTSQTACAAGTFSSTTGSRVPRVLTLQQDILYHLLVRRVRLHATLVTIKHPPVKHPVMLLMQATMFLAQPKRARLLVLLELYKQDRSSSCTDAPAGYIVSSAGQTSRLHAVLVTIRHLQGKLPVTMLMQATMFLAQPKRARPLVLLEPIKQAQDNPRVTMLMQATMFLAQPKRARLLVLRERTNPAQDNPRVTMLMQATMFLAQPKRARLLVLQEPIKQAQVNPRVTIPTLDITFHPPANRARPLDAGTYQSSTGQSSCDDADAGYYVVWDSPNEPDCLCCRNLQPRACWAHPHQPAQMPMLDQASSHPVSQTAACAAGTFQASTGQSSCDDADAGYYVSGTAQTSQTACAAGTFSSATGSISCTDALPGYFVPVQGQTSATECSIGYYQSASGQTSCDIADIGYYVDQTGQSSQTQCPTSTTTIATGSTSSLQCLSDHDGDQTVDALDEDDDNDGVDDINDLCPNGQSTLTSDNDGDGCDDSTEDADDDNDGVLDGDDDLPLDSTESLDTDHWIQIRMMMEIGIQKMHSLSTP